MGEVVSFAAYRVRALAAGPVGPDPARVPASLPDLCQDFAEGLQRMRQAARLLSEASLELRELAREP